MNRRNIVSALIGGFLGLFGVRKATAQEPSSKSNDPAHKTNGFIVCYQSVGYLPPYKAEMLVERIAEQMCKKRDKEFPGWAIIVVPVRPPQETHIEIHGVNGNHVDNITPVKIEGELAQIMVDDTPELRKRNKDYTLLMLGAPVIHIDLDKKVMGDLSLFDHVFEYVYRRMTETSYTANPVYHYCRTETCLKDGLVAFSTMYYGRMKDINDPERAEWVDRGIELIRIWEENLEDGNEFQLA